MIFQTDRPADAVRELLSTFGMCSDVQHHGEIARLFENRGYKRLYYRARGLTVDQLGERMLDRGIVAERPSPREILDLLDDVLRPAPRKRGRKCASANAVEVAEIKARTMRLRLFQCSCGQKARGTRNSALICGLCYEMHGEIRCMARIDPLPEEILAQAAATMSN